MILPEIDHLALVGAHCDDIAIGAGATVAMLGRARPGLRVTALVLTGADSEREAEERAALTELCDGADLTLTVADLPDNRLPGHWLAAKQQVVALRDAGEPDLVICPQPGDAHQDHRLVAELCAQTFRRQPVWGYEIAKYESDLPVPTTFVAVPEEFVRLKVDLITRCYPSQAHHPWFDAEAFTALMRLRGIQCNRRHAEAFVVPKTLVQIGAQS
ncbi:PIG-L family deacetylase [Arachnia propionica]|uniref:PIG-L family deacetylase n=1 Tax=Arachnia propionica TaxID=1750 RepID=A0A3P1T7N2_9ACTN|nr:PIG-L family deacetylase [Arachnia propionica]MDO5083776.1 PIG-L family deacetylase [Arachnia propionica]RRD05409.1 PIG-L family deacetylase [Arachnia propionica]